VCERERGREGEEREKGEGVSREGGGSERRLTDFVVLVI